MTKSTMESTMKRLRPSQSNCKLYTALTLSAYTLAFSRTLPYIPSYLGFLPCVSDGALSRLVFTLLRRCAGNFSRSRVAAKSSLPLRQGYLAASRVGMFGEP